MAKIIGKWTFNNALTLVSQMWYLNYSYGGTECNSMYISGGSLWYCTKDIGDIQVYMEGPGWLGNSYKTIDFGETGQTVDDSFYEWFTANAIQVLTLAEKLTIIANNEQKVYDAGYAEGLKNGGGGEGGGSYDEGFEAGKVEGIEIGRVEGYEQGEAAGKQAEYDAFWDGYQDCGNLKIYKYSFAGKGWNINTFKPKYDIKPTSATNMFQEFGNSISCDLVEILENQGVVLDTSNCTNLGTGFYGATFTHLPKIDMSSSQAGESSVGYLFANMGRLATIDEFVLKDDGTQKLETTFSNNTKLENIKFGGVIGQNLDIHWSPLTADSIKNIIEHLSPSASGKTLTLSQAAVDNAKFDSTVSVPAGCISGGGSLYSNPIYVKSGQRLKVELIVDDDHFYFPNTPTVYDDPQWWKVGLFTTWDGPWSPYNRSYIYAPISDDNHTVDVYFSQYTIDSSTQPARFSVRAVFVDENDNEITGENLFSAVEVYGIENIDGWEALRDSKPNWTISTQ